MLDLATLPLSLHKETAGSGLSRLDILRATKVFLKLVR